jgi:predicted metal-dependent phosphoesterase TrpH
MCAASHRQGSDGSDAQGGARAAHASSLRGLIDSPPCFELQSHSVFSDGELEPAGVVAAAAEAGVQVLALSDHDSVEGVPAAMAARVAHGIRCVPAVEISTIDPQGTDLHILGYLVDVANDNAERLAQEGLAEPSQFLVAYLIEGKPAFAPRDAPSVAEAIDLIHGAGGVAVWAHPFWDIADPTGVLSALDRFLAAGLDGVEAFYVTHNAEQTALLVERCATLDLLTTGSSDFHGPGHRQFNRFRAFSTFGLPPNLGPIAGSG